MAANANDISGALLRDMQQHTYVIMCEVEGKHWWFAGRRRIVSGFERICGELGKRKRRILDVGCGTGANIQMLIAVGATEGVDVSAEALDFVACAAFRA